MRKKPPPPLETSQFPSVTSYTQLFTRCNPQTNIYPRVPWVTMQLDSQLLPVLSYYSYFSRKKEQKRYSISKFRENRLMRCEGCAKLQEVHLVYSDSDHVVLTLWYIISKFYLFNFFFFFSLVLSPNFGESLVVRSDIKKPVGLAKLFLFPVKEFSYVEEG